MVKTLQDTFLRGDYITCAVAGIGESWNQVEQSGCGVFQKQPTAGATPLHKFNGQSGKLFVSNRL
jgi:hypothetical protein